jgi:homoserine kinase type II
MTGQTSSKQMIHNAATHFALGDVLSIDIAAGGDANRNYFVQTATGEYVIKHVLEHTEEEVKTEAAYLERADEEDFPVAPYLLADNSPTYTTAHGELVVAMPRVSGEHPNQTVTTAKAIGAAFGYLHTIPSEGLPQRQSWLSETYLPNALELIKEHFPNDTSYHQAFEGFDRQKLFGLPKSLIHGDMNDGNCIFENGQPKAFLDWEEATVGVSLLDLVVCIQNFCYDGDALNTKKALAMRSAYEDNRLLSGPELAQLGTAIGYAGLTVSAWYKLQCGLYNPAQQSNDREHLYWNRNLSALIGSPLH